MRLRKSFPSRASRTVRTILLSAVLATACESALEPREPTSTLRLVAVTPTELDAQVATAVTPPPTVRARDAQGNPLSGLAVSFITDCCVTSDQTDADGIARAGTWTADTTANTHTTMIARLPGAPDVRFTVRSRPGPATQIRILAGNDQVGTSGETLPLPLRVWVGDSFNNGAHGLPVRFTVVEGGGTIQPGDSVAGVNGVAWSGAWRLGPGAGVQRVRAEAGGLQVLFEATVAGQPAGLAGRLAVVSARDGNEDIYTVAASGGALERLTTHPEFDGTPAWSPDGSRIAFTRGDGARSIYVMNADGSAPARLADGYGELTWSPDGSAIAFSSAPGGLATVSVADARVVPLFDWPGYDAQPSWSPDGRRVAFVSDYAAYDFVYDIYTMRADGTMPVRLTNGFNMWPLLRYYLHPAWSPDGSMIAFVYGSIVNVADMRFMVAVMPADGGEIRDLAWAGDIPWRELLDPGSLAWSPDGRGIAYTLVDGARHVNYVSIDRKQQGRMVSNAHSPSWRR